MEQRLDAEYRKLIKEDMPDLWGRIEDGIDASPAQDGMQAEAPTHRVSRPPFASKLLRYGKYILPAAAVLLLALLISRTRPYRDTSQSTAMENAVVTEDSAALAMMAETTSADDAPEEIFEEAAEDDAPLTAAASVMTADSADMAADSFAEEATADSAEVTTADSTANDASASARFGAKEKSAGSNATKAEYASTGGSGAEKYVQNVIYKGSAESSDLTAQGEGYARAFSFTAEGGGRELTVLVSDELYERLRTDNELPKEGQAYDLTIRLADAVWMDAGAENERYELVSLVRK